MKPLGNNCRTFYGFRAADKGRGKSQERQSARREIEDGLEAAEDQVYIEHIIAADLAEAEESGRLGARQPSESTTETVTGLRKPLQSLCTSQRLHAKRNRR